MNLSEFKCDWRDLNEFAPPPLIRPTADWTGTFEAVERSRLLFGLVQSYLIDILLALVNHSI